MQRDFPEMEQTAFVIDYTSQIFKKIIKIFTFYEEIDKSLKKKENFVAFPFSFSFESSKSSSKNILKPTNFLKKRLMKNNTFSSISLLNNSNEMSNLFFKTHEDIISPHNLTERLFFQMEPDINYQKFIQKEYSSPFLEENLPNNSTIETENQQTNILEYQLKQIDEDKLLESVDDKDMIDFLANDLIKSKNFQNLGIEDEKIPNEAKNFQNIPKLIPFQQKNFFSDLDNSNITYIDESPLTITKKFKSHNVFTKNVVREGWFLRKTRNFMSGWESVWILVTQEKLQYFSDHLKTKLKGGINFRLAKCSVLSKDCTITIKIKGYNKFLKLKTTTKTLAREWAKLIEDIIFNNQTENKLDIRCENMDKYMNDDFISEEEFQEICESGDILLFETKNFPAKFQRSLTGSKYDHVALVMKFSNETWIFDAQADKGVSILKWSEFIDINDLFIKVVYRKLNYSQKDSLDELLLTFITNNIGKKYELSLAKIFFRKTSEVNYIDKKKIKKIQNCISKSGYFCSELVAAAYKEIGLLNYQLSSNQYWPGSFSTEKNLKLLNNASLSEEITVVMDRDLI